MPHESEHTHESQHVAETEAVHGGEYLFNSLCLCSIACAKLLVARRKQHEEIVCGNKETS